MKVYAWRPDQAEMQFRRRVNKNILIGYIVKAFRKVELCGVTTLLESHKQQVKGHCMLLKSFGRSDRFDQTDEIRGQML